MRIRKSEVIGSLSYLRIDTALGSLLKIEKRGGCLKAGVWNCRIGDSNSAHQTKQLTRKRYSGYCAGMLTPTRSYKLTVTLPYDVADWFDAKAATGIPRARIVGQALALYLPRVPREATPPQHEPTLPSPDVPGMPE